MSNTGDMAVGRPLRYSYDGETYYGIITAVVANTSVSVAGAPLNIALPITELAIGPAGNVTTLTFTIDAVFDETAQDILEELGDRYFKWTGAAARLVTFSATSKYPDSGTEPKINVKIADELVSTNDSNNGIQLSGDAGTWVDNSAVAINTTNYEIARGDAIEIACTATGGNGDAMCLTVIMTFVYE